MGWILPPGGVPELAHTISRNLYGRAPKELTATEQDVVVAWIAGRAPVSEAEVRRELLTDWVATNEQQGQALTQHNGGSAPASQAVQTRSVATSALGVRLQQTQKPKERALNAESKPLTLWEGAHSIDKNTFATLAKQGEVKFIITGSPQIAFMNTNAYEAHHAFAKGALGSGDSLAEFNTRAYFDEHRDIVCGSGVAGVAVTKNIHDHNAQGFYVNLQPGDDGVTSPEHGTIPEELLLRHDARTGRYVPHTLQRSSEGDGPLLTSSQQQELAQHLAAIEAHFRGVYGAWGDEKFAMDVEFIVDNDRVRVVQARPWVDGG